MFGDINKVTLMGNVTKDPELRYTPSGASVLSFSLATNRRYKKGDEWVDEPSFHNIIVWNQAEALSQRIKKGTRLYLEGRVHTRSWDGADGKKNYKTEIISDRVILISRFEGSIDTKDKNIEDFSSEVVEKSSQKRSEPEEDDSIDPNDLPF